MAAILPPFLRPAGPRKDSVPMMRLLQPAQQDGEFAEDTICTGAAYPARLRRQRHPRHSRQRFAKLWWWLNKQILEGCDGVLVPDVRRVIPCCHWARQTPLAAPDLVGVRHHPRVEHLRPRA